ncbi:MAG TPA: Crp/Fnr family transcriptional regulator [Nevskiaceae bacterium]|nr:Crp/Fnr family transcriptional regulator [Nevskiaceae bacterium]
MNNITSAPLAPLLGNARRRSYAKGQIILYQGDTTGDMLVLKQGGVKMYDIDDQGNEKILHILRPPAIFPLVSYLFKQSEILWFYAALTDVEIYILPYADVVPHMQEDGKLAMYLLARAVNEMHELLVRLNSLGKTTTHDKLLAALKFLAVHHATVRANGWRRVTFTITHQLLADMTGITRETATMTMKQLQEEKIVRSPRLGVLEINFAKLIQA